MKQYTVLWILSLLFWIGNATAEPKPDSLLRAVSKASISNQLLDDVFQKMQEGMDSTSITILYNEILKKDDVEPFLYRVHYDLGVLYKGQRKFVGALEHLLKARSLVSNKNEQAKVLFALGELYNDWNRSAKALDYWLQTAEIYALENDKKAFYETNHQIAVLYYRTGFFEESESYFKSLTKVGKDSLQPRTVINTWNGLGLIYYQSKKYASAIAHFDKAMKIAETQKDTVWVGILSGNLGNIYLAQGDSAIATYYFEKDLEISLEYKEWGSAVNACVMLSEVALSQNRVKTAQKYLNQALTIKAKYEQADTPKLYKALSNYYYKERQYQQAFDYFQIYHNKIEELRRLRKETAINSLKNTVAFDKKEFEIQLLQQENEVVKTRSKLQNWIIANNVALLVIVGIIAFFLYKNSRQKQKNNEALQEQKAEIQALNENLEQIVNERTMQLQTLVQDLSKQNQDLEHFSFIISHNIRASVAHILGLSEIFNKENLADKQNAEVINRMEKSARNLDMVIGDLGKILTIRSKTNQVIENCEIEAVYQQVTRHLKAEIEDIQAKTSFVLEGNTHFPTVRGYLYNIFYELMNNAIKYHNPRRPLQMKINVHCSDEYLEITVADNGLGLDPKYTNDYKVFGLYQRMHTHVSGKGLGLFILKTQAEALNGTINFESQLNEGSLFRVKLPFLEVSQPS